MKHKTVNIFGVEISLTTYEELNNYIQEKIVNNSKSVILNVNAHALNLIYEDPIVKSVYVKSDLVFMDGIGPKYAYRLSFSNLDYERITYFEWMPTLFSHLPIDTNFYLLGGTLESNYNAISNMRTNYGINVFGHHGYFNFDKETTVNDVINDINSKNIHVLIVCLGMPYQELFISEYAELIDTNVFLTGGGYVDLISGNLERPNKLFVRHDLEWLGRFFMEPKRLWKRYLIGNIKFIYRVFKSKCLYQR